MRLLQRGGTLFDLDLASSDAELSQQVGMLIRTDLAVQMHHPHRQTQALQLAEASFSESSTPGRPWTIVGNAARRYPIYF